MTYNVVAGIAWENPLSTVQTSDTPLKMTIHGTFAQRSFSRGVNEKLLQFHDHPQDQAAYFFFFFRQFSLLSFHSLNAYAQSLTIVQTHNLKGLP